MPYKDKPIEKKYFTISAVAEMMHQNKSTLRFWEDEFDWIHPKRNRKNNRQYKRSDITDLMTIAILIVCGGMTLEGVKKAYRMKYIEELKTLYIERQRNYQSEVPEELKMPLDYYIPDPPCKTPE
jgi:DNA-binding transcriptional MerR regulator